MKVTKQHFHMKRSALFQRGEKVFKKNLPLFILGLPGIIYFFIFAYLPMFGITIAFKDFNVVKGFWGSEWVGFKNFEFLFKTGNAWRITRNTVIMNSIFIILGNISSIGIALLLFEITKRFFLKLYQTIIIFPHFLSWVVVSFMAYAFLATEHGLLNSVIVKLGGEKVIWYMEPFAWRFILPIANLWKNAGWGSIIYYAALVGINKEYYEAAAIDGATKLQITRHVSIPFLVPLITILTIMAIGKIFYSDFGLFYQLPRDIGALYETTDVIDTYVFRSMRVTGNTGMAAAAGLYQSAIGFVLVLITNYTIRKIEPDNALF